MKIKTTLLLSATLVLLASSQLSTTVKAQDVKASTYYLSSSIRFNQNHQENQYRSLLRTAKNEINMERHKRGLKPYKFDNILNKVAQKRSKQIVSNFSHYNKQQQGIAALLMPKHTNLTNLSENISMIQDTTHDDKQNVKTSIHGMFYDDAGSHWGHRDNFLNKDNNRIGIGVHITKNHSIYLSFDMAKK